MKSYKYTLEGLDCAACAKKVEDEIANTEGYKDVVVNFSTLKLTFKTNKPNPKKEITKLVQKLEPDVEVLEDGEENHDKEEHNGNDIARIVVGIAIYLIAIIGKFNTTVTSVLTIIAFAILLYKTAKKGFKQLFKNKVLDENMLIVVSAIGAYLVGKNSEGLMVITLYEIGKILESKAVNKTRKSISDLMNIKPEYANLKQGEEWKQVIPDKVKIGDVILVKTGEKIPLDGIVIKGNAQIDNSTLTGESKLLEVAENSKVLSGSINTNGLIEVKVEQTYENSTVSQILNLVENATDKKAKTETFVSKAAKIYTPVVMGFALLVAIFMPLIIAGVTYKESIYKALIFLVISCPCSIAISVPLSYFSGIGKSSKEGILIKGSDYIDAIKDIKEIVFDKTGTLTKGEFEIQKIDVLSNYNEQDILKYAAMGEKYSNHPIAKSIMKANKEEIAEAVREAQKKIILFEDAKNNPEVIRQRMQDIDHGMANLLTLAAQSSQIELFEKKFKEMTEEKARLTEQLKQAEEDATTDAKRQKQLDDILKAIDIDIVELTEFDDTFIRRIVEQVTILSKDKIEVRFIGGFSKVGDIPTK